MGTCYEILVHAKGETRDGPSKAIAFLNERRHEVRHYGLFEITEPKDEALGYGAEPGGTGHFAGSAKNLHVDGFKKLIDAAPWEWREQVVFVISEDAGDTIEIYRPKPETPK